MKIFTKTSYFFDLCWISLAVATVYLIFLGHNPLFVPDDARYAEIAREMLKSGNFVVPHLNHVLYFEKPPLAYWLTAFSLKIFGVNEWAARFPQVVFAVFGAAITYFAGRKLYDRQTGILSATILASSPLYYVMAHILTLDLGVSVFLSACLFFFIIGASDKNIKALRLYIYFAAIFAALAFLTKGLIGIIFPLMIIGLWVIFCNQWKAIKGWPIISGLFVFTIIIVPWHILIQLRHPAFFHFYFIYEQFTRYATKELHRYQPFWFFIPILLVGFCPWSFYLFQSLKKTLAAKNCAQNLFLFIWIVTIFSFFSFSNSKLAPYILPIFPPMAVIVAHYVIEKIRENSRAISFLWPAYALIAVQFVVNVILILLPAFIVLANPNWIRVKLIALAFISTIVFIQYIIYFIIQRKMLLGIYTLALSTLTLCVGIMLFAGNITDKSIKPLAVQINQQKTKNAEIVTFDHYFQDLPFYVKKRVTIVNWKNELSFGYNQDSNVANWMIDTPTFIKRFTSKRKLYVISHKNRFNSLKISHPELQYRVLGETNDNILFTN